MEEEKTQREREKHKKSVFYNEEEDKPKGPPSIYKENGDIRICNQGKYEFYLDEDNFKTGLTTFELKIPKFLDTTQVQCDLNPWYVRVDVKGKITQLKFSYEIITSKATVQRSQITGYLVIKAPMVEYLKKWEMCEINKIACLNTEKDKSKKKALNNNINNKNPNNYIINNIEVTSKVESELENKIKSEKVDLKIEEKKIKDNDEIDISDLPELD